MKRSILSILFAVALIVALVPAATAMAGNGNNQDGFIECHGIVLPEVVNFNIRDWANPDTFRIIVDEIGYDGLGWCADAGTRIESGANTFFDGNVYISLCLEGAPDCVTERPWGSINWILNNWRGLGYTSGDAQVAMWSLIHDYDFGDFNGTNFFGLTWNQSNVDDLVAQANPDFVPEPGDLVAVVLLVGNLCPGYEVTAVPPWVVDRDPAKQMVFIELERPEPLTYDICGFKYADWEGGLIPLSGWNITLEKWDGADWIAIDWVETDTDGKYCFPDLEAGTYRISENLEPGWEQVYPDPEGAAQGAHIVVLPGGQTYAEESTILYGTQRNNPGNNGLYEINLDTGYATRLFNTGGSGNSPNALGFDPENRRLYYMKVKESVPYYSHLYFYDIEAGTETHAGLDLTGEVVVGASFYDGSYYYIPNLTADLHKVTLNTDGTVDEDILLWPNFNGAHHAVYRFGDFAISRGGMLYASTNDTGGSTAEFFKLDVATGEYTLIADSNTPDAALLLQVSFGSDGTLYGHSAGTGEFFTIDLQTGVRTSIGYVESDLRTRELFSDLASGTQPKYYDFVNTPEVYCEGQTAWAADPHPGDTRFSNANNWATYVEYARGDGTELEPKAYPLYAGQHYLAGMLYVWDDGDTLHVNYSTDIPEEILDHAKDCPVYEVEGYCEGGWTGFLEYHLHVADAEDGIPRTRTGRNRVLSNPIPGHFKYDGYFDPAEDETGWVQVGISELGDEFVIAAHAVMQWCGYDCDALEEIEAALQP